MPSNNNCSLTSVKIKIKDKSNYKSHGLQLVLFTITTQYMNK